MFARDGMFDMDGQTLPTKIIDYGQGSDLAAVEQVVGHEIHGPALIYPTDLRAPESHCNFQTGAGLAGQVNYRNQQGQTDSNWTIKRDSYGHGVHMNQYGQPVYDSQPGHGGVTW